jgi:hypothetical protein
MRPQPFLLLIAGFALAECEAESDASMEYLEKVQQEFMESLGGEE